MLPSRGYFKSADCPFYNNNLCHRFYCHFRHTKNERAVFKNERSEIINSSLSVIEQGSINLINTNNDSSTERTPVSQGNSQNKYHKMYFPPENIPSYNPTPISELNTRNRHLLCENVEHITKYPATCRKYTTKGESNVNKCSDLSKELVNYFVDSDVLYKIVSKTINEIATTNNSKAELQLDSNQLNFTHDVQENHSDKNNYTTFNNEGNLQVKEVILPSKDEFDQLQSTAKTITKTDNATVSSRKELFKDSQDSLTEEKNYTQKTAILNRKLKDPLMTDKNNFKTDKNEIKKRKKNSQTSVNQTNKNEHQNSTAKQKKSKIKLHKFSIDSHNNKKHRSNHDTKSNTDNEKSLSLKREHLQIPVVQISDTESSNEYDEFDEIVKSIQDMHKSNKAQDFPEFKRKVIKGSRTEYDEFDEIVKCLQQVPKDNYKSNPANKAKLERQKSISKSEKVEEVIVSDSEVTKKYDEFDGIVKNVQEIQHSNQTEDFPPQKKKIRISHVKTNSIQSNPQKLKTVTTSSDNNKPIANKKKRLEHTKSETNSITLNSTREYLSSWEQVKERVESKCINPSGEEDQDWSKVKISPVLNVSSILKSKQLLYAKINRWNSEKK